MLFNDDLNMTGGLTAILAVGAIMMAIVSCGVTIGALTAAPCWASPSCGSAFTASASC